MSTRVGLATIGQAPRDDIVPGMQRYLPPEVEVFQAGALDGLGLAEVGELAPQPGDYVLISRMADGSAVKLARRHVLPRLEAAVRRLEAQGCEAVAVLCTGTFPELKASRLLIEPERLFHAACAGIAGSKTLGALIPLADQVAQAKARWTEVGAPSAVVVPASPYASGLDGIREAALELRQGGVDLVALDCFGYTEEMRRAVREVVGRPVLLANSYLARVLAEVATS